MSFVNEQTGRGTSQELIVFLSPSDDDWGSKRGVLVNGRTGKATNRWGDGTVGVPASVAELAEEEMEAYMPYSFERYVWKHQ